MLAPGVGMVRGFGDRRDDCRGYADCLHAFVQVSPTASAARCPSTCLGYVAVSQEERRAEAMAGNGQRWVA